MSETKPEYTAPVTDEQLRGWREKASEFHAIGSRDDYDREAFIEMAEPAMPALLAEVERLRADALAWRMVTQLPGAAIHVPYPHYSWWIRREGEDLAVDTDAHTALRTAVAKLTKQSPE